MQTLRKAAGALSLLAVVLVGVDGSASAQGSGGSPFINASDIKWGPAPPSMPKGAKIAVLQGDPGKPGPFVIRLMVPAGYKVAPHWHSQDESLTVISGALAFGTGDKVETSKSHTLTAGGFHSLAGKDHHYVVAKTQAVLQVSGTGPFDMTYVNADDDPQKAKK